MSAILIAVVAALAADAVPSANWDWMSRPRAIDLAQCVPGKLPRGGIAVRLDCQTAPNDRIENCRVTTASGPVDQKVERGALCSVKYFRVRATDSAGQTLVGVPVSIPMNLSGR